MNFFKKLEREIKRFGRQIESQTRDTGNQIAEAWVDGRATAYAVAGGLIAERKGGSFSDGYDAVIAGQKIAGKKQAQPLGQATDFQSLTDQWVKDLNDRSTTALFEAVDDLDNRITSVWDDWVSPINEQLTVAGAIKDRYLGDLTFTDLITATEQYMDKLRGSGLSALAGNKELVEANVDAISKWNNDDYSGSLTDFIRNNELLVLSGSSPVRLSSGVVGTSTLPIPVESADDAGWFSGALDTIYGVVESVADTVVDLIPDTFLPVGSDTMKDTVIPIVLDASQQQVQAIGDSVGAIAGLAGSAVATIMDQTVTPIVSDLVSGVISGPVDDGQGIIIDALPDKVVVTKPIDQLPVSTTPTISSPVTATVKGKVLNDHRYSGVTMKGFKDEREFSKSR